MTLLSARTSLGTQEPEFMCNRRWVTSGVLSTPGRRHGTAQRWRKTALNKKPRDDRAFKIRT